MKCVPLNWPKRYNALLTLTEGDSMTIRRFNITQWPDFKTADYRAIILNPPSAEELLNIKPPRFTSEFLESYIAGIKKIMETNPGATVIANDEKIN